MKALIFNSGLGSRMGEQTRTHHKCMTELPGGETILYRQLRLLYAAGIREVVITTGPFREQIEATVARFPEMTFTLVDNPRYKETNYIYSFYLAREVLDDDLLMLHGDLVFDDTLVPMLLQAPSPSACLYNPALPLPEKDFKCRLSDGELREVSVRIFGDDCYAFQPLYKLSRDTVAAWIARICDFVAAGDTGVYAENALNTITDTLHITALSYEEHLIDEVDTPEDLVRLTPHIVACG